MKIKLFNGGVSTTVLNVTSGGYDTDQGRFVLIVQGEHDGQAGSITLEPAEAARIVTLLSRRPDPRTLSAVPKQE